MTLYGFDISNNNGPNLSIAEIAREGFSWCEMKVSEGDYFLDPDWLEYKAQASAAGMPILGYHYAIAACAPAAQAATFQRAGGGTAVMIDFEANSGTITDYWALVRAFNAIGVAVATSYVPQWYWEQIGQPDLSQVPGLMASAFPRSSAGFAAVLYGQDGGDSGEGWTPYGNGDPVIWQFTDCALIDGTTVDANAFRGTSTELAALLGTARPEGGTLMALTDAQQTELYAKVCDLWDQARGPGGKGWAQLGVNASGQQLTPVDAQALEITEQGVLLSMVKQLGTNLTQLTADVATLLKGIKS